MPTAKNLGERKIIETIWKQLETPTDMAVRFGDDVSAIKYQDNNLLIIKTDMLVGKTDVPPKMTYWQAARKAIIMNISDLAAKGAKPKALLTSLGLPPNLTKRDIQEIGKGLNAGAREYATYILGGDTCETQDLIISIALIGLAKKEDLILRSGARPGDIVATTGPFGLTACGLKILKEKLAAKQKIRKKLVASILMPHARLREGLALAKTGIVTASIDSSDGFAWSLHEISRASNVGFTIDNLPTAPEVRQFARLHNLNPVEICLYGGEEYELIITINPKYWRIAKKAITQQGSVLHRIGKTTREKALIFKQGDRTIRIEERGYEHFKH